MGLSSMVSPSGWLQGIQASFGLGSSTSCSRRKEKPPEVEGVKLLSMDMKKFRNEKQERLFQEVEDFLQTFQCVGSFSQDKKEPNSIVVPGESFLPVPHNL